MTGAHDTELQDLINRALPLGVSATLHELTSGELATYSLILMHGSRRQLIELDRPFDQTDIPEIVEVAHVFLARNSRAPRYVDDPDEADAMPL